MAFLEYSRCDSFLSSFEFIDSEIGCEDGFLVFISEWTLSLVEPIESFLYVSRREIGDSVIIVDDVLESRKSFDRIVLDVMLGAIHFDRHESCPLSNDVLFPVSLSHKVCQRKQ